MALDSIVFNYHESTKHTPESLRRNNYGLDWASMPHPWRHYDGAPIIDLPANIPVPAIGMMELLHGHRGARISAGAELLSSLFFYSAAVSATKVVASAGYRYALRVNPSSGNLHPTEFHFITRGMDGWEDGIYHYRPSDHTAEQRARGLEPGVFPHAKLVIVMTAIAWREAWKYQSRAYRYCCLDLGHAQESVRLAGAALGLVLEFHGSFQDDVLGRALRLPADEWPLGVLVASDATQAGGRQLEWTAGTANQLSSHPVEYPLITDVHQATKNGGRWRMEHGWIAAPIAAGRDFANVVRTRRSALNFRGLERIPRTHLDTLLRVGSEGAASIDLFVYVHLVDGMEQGVYHYRAGLLAAVHLGDQRVRAAGLSLGQDLAGTSCLTISMIANLAQCGYRQAHFEAGATGQRLYLAAEAMGLNCTGIGAFFDEEVRRYLGIDEPERQVVYHFAIGHKVEDSRIEELSRL